MANDEHLHIMKQGVAKWNDWKRSHPEIVADLSGISLPHVSLVSANLAGANLAGANLGRANLSGALLLHANLINAGLSHADLSRALLSGANFSRANLTGANLFEAHLVGANFNGTLLRGTDLCGTLLRGADLRGADLRNANLCRANLDGVHVSEAHTGGTVFDNIDLRGVKGLESIKHGGPSEISISTLYLSKGQIPENFLRGCGVPDEFIIQIPALVAAIRPIQFYSCFISYSSKDEEFARRLHERMRRAGLRVWFAPEDIKGGEKLYEQIDRAIQIHDRLLLVLSESSMKSEWVMTELRRARKSEIKENQRKLFPIRLADFNTFKDWECFDADQGKDLAVEVREYFIPDFSNWKNHDDFEAAFKRLLGDLKSSV